MSASEFHRGWVIGLERRLRDLMAHTRPTVDYPTLAAMLRTYSPPIGAPLQGWEILAIESLLERGTLVLHLGPGRTQRERYSRSTYTLAPPPGASPR